MTPLWNILDALLGLSGVSWSDPRASLGWRWPLPAWAWVLIVAGSVLVGLWSYRRMLGPLWARVALASLRAALVLALAALIAGPMIVIAREQVEPDWLLVLVDRSASMGIRDMANDGDEPISRDAALRAALARQVDLFGEENLARERRVVWLGFDSGTFEITPPDDAAPWAEPVGESTMLRSAIEQALQRAAGRPISGVVVMSDGRSPQPTGGELVRRLRQQAINVFAVPLGAEAGALDLSIAEVDAPDRAFINDAVPVTVWVDRFPEDAPFDASRLRVKLVDVHTGETLDERPVTDPTLQQPVRLTAQSAAAGPAQWRVELEYLADVASASAVRDELILDNNWRDVLLEFVDRPLGVLYVEAGPRWEYRYLKNMLVREDSVRSSMMLISADRAFAQEGQLPISRLPSTPEELRPYDVIVIGDVPSDYFSADQLAMIRDHVALRGAGLLWIGGESENPRSYEGTPLAGLLPMRSPAAVDRLHPTLGPVKIAPTPLAEALGVMRLRSDPASRGDERLWPETLPPLFWAQNTGELARSAEVLGVATSADGESWPAILRMRYGAGQIVYVATDETWRWRYGRGELYFEQFWMQMLRMLGRSRLHSGDERATLTVSSRRAELNQPVVLNLRINDEMLAQRSPGKIAVAVTRAGAPLRSPALATIELQPTAALGGMDGGGSEYRAIWPASVSGRLALRVAEPSLADLVIEQALEVIRPDDELRQPAPDHERLASVAQETGGRVLALDELGELASLVPNRARRTPDDIRHPLWNSYLAMGLVVGLLTMEWVGRKMIRLV